MWLFLGLAKYSATRLYGRVRDRPYIQKNHISEIHLYLYLYMRRNRDLETGHYMQTFLVSEQPYRRTALYLLTNRRPSQLGFVSLVGFLGLGLQAPASGFECWSERRLLYEVGDVSACRLTLAIQVEVR